MSRTRNSAKNVIFAFLLQFIKIVANFVVRTAMMNKLGMGAYSLNGLFTEVLSALSLAELGVGTAIIYNLYKPLADNDQVKVRQLMQLFKKSYRIIALVTFVLGACLCPFIQYLVNSVDYPLWYVRVIYMLFVANLSISYLFTYKISLLNADQKNYVRSRISAVLTIVSSLIFIGTIYLFNNYILYLIVMILFTVINNVVNSIIVDKTYPWLNMPCDGVPKEERTAVFGNIKNLFIKSLSGKITNSTDNILISTLVNTLLVGYYSNYSLIIGVFRQISDQIAYSGVGASLGNLLATSDKNHCKKVFYRLVYLFFCIASVSCVAIFCSIEPFILAWRKSDEFLLPLSILAICCLNFFIEVVNRPLWSIMEVSGLFAQDKYVSIAGSVVNLIVSVVLGRRIGMLGIFIGTFFTYLIQSVLKIWLLFVKIFQTTPFKYYLVLLLMFTSTFVQTVIAHKICSLITIESNILRFFVFGIISSCISIAFVVVTTFRTSEFEYYVELISKFIKKKAIGETV